MNLTKTPQKLKKISVFYLAIFLTFFLTNTFVYAQTTNEVAIVRDGVTFTFSVSCDNGPCEFGQFVNGDYWVAPNAPTGNVLISNITPDGEFNGAMVNPDLLRDPNNPAILLPFTQQKQGVLNTYSHYEPTLNLMNSLPYLASPGESIYKALGTTVGCGTSSIYAGCVQTATILTILSEIPPERGVNTFRPPFHGDWKPLYDTANVKMNRLPNLPQASDGNNGIIGGEFGFMHWLTPEIELYHQGLGEFHRAVIPHAAQPPYGSDQALQLLEDITQVFGLETAEEKRMAVYSLIQKGIDNYGVFKMGVPFSSGAGQHMGKKPALAFFAAMYDDIQILEAVRAIALDEDLQNNAFFQEDAQIRMGNGGVPLWGDINGYNDVHLYFSRLYPRIDTKGTNGDPYRYIDGPAGGIHPDPNQTADRNYLPVVGALHVGYAFLQHLMPWFKHAANDPEIIAWSDRMYSGYGVPNFDGGLWTKPDPVAPYDSNETSECSPFRLYSTGITNCNLYMSTWGPNPTDVSDFIAHNGDPNTDGRMPQLHGVQINFTRVPVILRDHWDELRACADPNNPNYPCTGLGEEPNGQPLHTVDDVTSHRDKLIITSNAEMILFKASKSYQNIQLKVYALTGALITSKKGSGHTIELKKSETGIASSNVYIYKLFLDNDIYTGKIVIEDY